MPASPQPPVMSHMNPDIARLHITDHFEASFNSLQSTLKRRASSDLESVADPSSRKRLKEDTNDMSELPPPEEQHMVNGQVLADELEQELQCGCCAALVYNPVVVSPCQHFFCGSCMVLWIRNGGTHCPACRGVSMVVTPSRPLQIMTEVLVRAAPWKARTTTEKQQADELYRAGLSIRIPTPRAASPEPAIPQGTNNNYVQPCPHCLPGNQWGWRCPQPIADPEIDPDSAWSSDNGVPPGHAYCGNCESLLAVHAPTTTKCDFCQVSFCGVAIPGRCVAAPLGLQHPHGMSDLGDLVQCGELYEAFDYNAVEVEILLDYLTAQRLTPRHIYKEIIAIILRSPRQFTPLFEADLFSDIHPVAGGVDPDPTAPRSKICRMCAAEILIWGLKIWWIQERKKGFLEEHIMSRPDCREGPECPKQKDQAHAKEFNHVFGFVDIVEPSEAGPANGHGAPGPADVPMANGQTSQLRIPEDISVSDDDDFGLPVIRDPYGHTHISSQDQVENLL